MRPFPSLACAAFTLLFDHVIAVDQFNLVKDYSGQTFFTPSDWVFYDHWDDLTNGNALFLGQDEATAEGLISVNSAGRAVIRLDNGTVANGDDRNSVYMTSTATYGVGSLIVADFVHMPYGCSVWPAFWTKGQPWPEKGEIDIVEAVNLMNFDQINLHSFTNSTCKHDPPPTQLGTSFANSTDCSEQGNTGNTGCFTQGTPNSFGAGFAQNGGGVFAMQFDVAGIYIWFFARDKIPPSIAAATPTSGISNISDFGPPQAGYPATGCNITEWFGPQQLVFDITVCGWWCVQLRAFLSQLLSIDRAGLGSVYNVSGCQKSPSGTCYIEQVVGDGSNFDTAYFEINYVRAYNIESASTANGPAGGTSASPGASAGVASGSPVVAAPSGAISGGPELWQLKALGLLEAVIVLALYW